MVLSTFQMVVAQNGTITGTVTETEGTEPVVGATVRLMLDSTMVGGGYTDDAGIYTISAKPGTYSLVFTYISYETKTLENVTVGAGETVTQDLKMGLDVEETGDENTVLITGKVVRNTEGALINMRRKSTSVMDVISLDQVKRAGDNDAGGAIKRVTGVTVEGGKYVYVRGLGDRYSKTLLNGAELPGLDPNRNSVQMDMFPSNLLDNLVVHKTFSPELPGSFTGGLVKINTKEFPETFQLKYTSSFGYNTAASLRDDFLSAERGGTDFLGFDDGTRALPAILDAVNSVPNVTFSNTEQAAQLDATSKAFGTSINPANTNSGINHSHSFSIGDQKTLFGKPFGYVASLSYNNTKTMRTDDTEGRWQLVNHVDASNDLNNLSYLRGRTSSREILFGGLVNFSYMPSVDHKFGLNVIHNHSGINTARYLSGPIPKDDVNLVFETRVAGYTQRMMDALQLKGDHNFGKLKADWIAAYTISSQDEPDLRFFSNDFTRDDTLYDIQRNLYTAPSRYFREMNENNLDARVNFELPFKQWNQRESNFKFGGAFTAKDRDFFERRFEFVNGSNGAISYEGDPDAYWAAENFGLQGRDQNGLFQWGHYLSDASELRNNYRGNQQVIAAYGMVELPLMDRLRFVGGGRFETTNIDVASTDPQLTPGELNNADLLPSANLIYTLNEKSVKNIMNFRASYARTLARPTFRELAPFASFNFVGDFVLVGSADLERTLIDNFDLRWELFPTTRELVSVSAFYKRFTNPIELVINTRAANTELVYRNVPEAMVYGVEFEFRRSLGFISGVLDNFRAGANLTLVRSAVDINPQELQAIQVLNPYADAQRQMFGQSPYTVNAELAYINDSIGVNTALNFNVFGPRISAVSIGGTPNVFEQPRPTLDFSIGKQLGEVFSVRFRARNLLNPEFKQTHTFKDQDFTYSSYRLGRTFSLSFSYTIQ